MKTKTRPAARESRLEMRLKPQDKSLLEAAARLQGVNVSAYILAQSIPAARSAVGDANALVLSDHDRNRFLDMLSSPPKPNKNLKKAMQRYQKLSKAQ